ncbi:MAG: hypothetical protein EBX81_00500 [bacterium]|nr:hypothetical protein [Candidatus Aquidulcis sp.]
MRVQFPLATPPRSEEHILPAAAPRRRLINDPGFLRLWAAETISHLGSSFSGLAMPIVAIELLSAGPMEIALINLADFLPFLLFGLLIGALVDRLPRRGILIVGDLGRALLLLTIPIAFALDVLDSAAGGRRLSPWHAYRLLRRRVSVVSPLPHPERGSRRWQFEAGVQSLCRRPPRAEPRWCADRDREGSSSSHH